MTSQIFKFAIAAAALAGAAPVLAESTEQSFERDGYTYVYNVTEQGSAKHIRGKYYPGGRPFALEVRNGRVEGTVNGNGVTFPVASAKTSGALASAR